MSDSKQASERERRKKKRNEMLFYEKNRRRCQPLPPLFDGQPVWLGTGLGPCVATVVMLIVVCFVVLLCMSCARTSAAVAASEQ